MEGGRCTQWRRWMTSKVRNLLAGMYKLSFDVISCQGRQTHAHKRANFHYRRWKLFVYLYNNTWPGQFDTWTQNCKLVHNQSTCMIIKWILNYSEDIFANFESEWNTKLMYLKLLLLGLVNSTNNILWGE